MSHVGGKFQSSGLHLRLAAVKHTPSNPHNSPSQALHYKKYSTASDVWSYGALMYEIWSVGHKPFEDVTNSKVTS
jgi:serine/threonine protein kinase